MAVVEKEEEVSLEIPKKDKKDKSHSKHYDYFSHNKGVPMYNYPCVDGMGGLGGLGGGGLLTGLLFGSVLNRRGGLFGGGDGDCGDSGRSHHHDGFGPLFSYQAGVNAGEAAKYRDVVDATSTLNASIADLGIATRNGFDVTVAAVGNVKDQLFAVSTQMNNGFACVEKAICETNYNNLLQAKELSHQLAMQTCEIKEVTREEAEKTRAASQAQWTQELRDSREELARQRDLLATGNFPISQPAHVERHHHCCNDGHRDGVAEQIINVNNNVNAIGSTVTQLAAVLQALIPTVQGLSAKLA